VPLRLREAGLTIVSYYEEYRSEEQKLQVVEDHIWLAKCGREGWSAVTQDRAIYRDPLARLAIVRTKARVFTFRTGNMTSQQTAENFLRARIHVERVIAETVPPFIARIDREGRISSILTESDLTLAGLAILPAS